jgi:hypothetical protein
MAPIGIVSRASSPVAARAAAEKLAAWATEEHLVARARRGDRAKFEAALAHVSDREPDPDDAIDEVTPRRGGA